MRNTDYADFEAMSNRIANDINHHVCENILLALMAHTSAAALTKIIASVAADAAQRDPCAPYAIAISNFAGALADAANDLQRDCDAIDRATHNRRYA